MRRRMPLLVAAAVVSVAADLVLVAGAARNRGGEPESSVELTERELRLLPTGEERTWVSLRLDWNGDLQEGRTEPGWFDREKLVSLGFDCGPAADDPRAPGHYGWQPPREMWVVLEADGESARRWLADREAALRATLAKLGGDPGASDAARRAREAFEKDRAARSRLFAVDAGTDAALLRQRHPDRSRFVVTKAIVRAELYRRWDPETRTLGPAFIRGRIDRLLVEEVRVPREKRALLDDLGARDREAARASQAGAQSPGTPADGAPRYKVLLRHGRSFEPWVEEVRPL